MTKLLTKYRAVLLSVFGVIIMIAFVLPQGFQTFVGTPESQTSVRIGGKRFTVADTNKAAAELEAVRRVLPRLAGLFTDREHWLMLTEMARGADLIGPEQDGYSLAEALAQQQALAEVQQGQIAPDQAQQRTEALAAELRAQLSQTIGASRRSSSTGARAMADFLGISRLQSAYIDMARTSGPRLLADARRDQDQALARVVFATVSEAAVQAQPEPTPEQLAAHFESFAGTDPATGDLGVGYLQPDRLKLAWIAVDLAQVRRDVRLDPVELATRRVRAAIADDDQAGRARVEEEYRVEAAGRLADQAMQLIRGELLRVVDRLPAAPGRGGIAYRQLPEDWPAKRPDFAALARSVTEQMAAAAGHPVGGIEAGSFAEGWLTPEDAASKLGRAGLTFQSRGRAFTQLAQALSDLREFDPPAPRLPVQVGVPITDPFNSFDGQLRVLYMVTEAAPAGPARSLDDVRQQAVRDWKRLNVYTELVREAQNAATFAVVSGLQEASAGLGLLASVTPPLESLFTRTQGMVPPGELAQGTPLTEEVIKRAERLDPSVPLTEANLAARTFAVPLPSKLSVALVQVTAYQPLTIERLRADAGAAGPAAYTFVREPSRRALGPTLLRAFDPALLAERLDARYPDGTRPHAADPAPAP
ncbi:MAG: hypothetical protein C0475_03615 [Planctomyces sp.]|nr:hypothetical protein [Planctomyces sp.]MBA4039158.1 hypothetical protein [Planctomyces sp.]